MKITRISCRRVHRVRAMKERALRCREKGWRVFLPRRHAPGVRRYSIQRLLS